jgi:homoserine kinase type II
MAVYTRIPNDELNAFIKPYDAGNVISIKDILSGVENSNFLLTTDTNKF